MFWLIIHTIGSEKQVTWDLAHEDAWIMFLKQPPMSNSNLYTDNFEASWLAYYGSAVDTSLIGDVWSNRHIFEILYEAKERNKDTGRATL